MKFYHATTGVAAESILNDGVLKADAFGEVLGIIFKGVHVPCSAWVRLL